MIKLKIHHYLRIGRAYQHQNCPIWS